MEMRAGWCENAHKALELYLLPELMAVKEIGCSSMLRSFNITCLEEGKEHRISTDKKKRDF
jgi:hypothetical protein